MKESTKQTLSLIGQRFRNIVDRKVRLLIKDDGVHCQLEGIDRRCVQVAREILIGSDVWERVV